MLYVHGMLLSAAVIRGHNIAFICDIKAIEILFFPPTLSYSCYYYY